MPTPSGDSWPHPELWEYDPLKAKHEPDEKPHVLDPHYDAAGKWTCQKCRQPVRLIPESSDKTPAN